MADTIWLKRFAQHPARFPELSPFQSVPDPGSLDQIVYRDFAALRQQRVSVDAMIITWANALTPDQLGVTLVHANIKGVVSSKRFSSLVVHFFNHQTHHRGQATTLLSQADVDIGSTDLLTLIPNEG